jgi:hypothetical protein
MKKLLIILLFLLPFISKAQSDTTYKFWLILDEIAAEQIDGVKSTVDTTVVGVVRREVTNIPCTQTLIHVYFPDVLDAYIRRKGGGCSILIEADGFLKFP